MQYLELLPEIRENVLWHISRFDEVSLMIYQHVFDRKPMKSLNYMLLVQACRYDIKFVTFCIDYYRLHLDIVLEAEAEAGNSNLFALHCDSKYFGTLTPEIYFAAARGLCLPLLKFIMANDYVLNDHQRVNWRFCYHQAGVMAAMEIIEWLRSCHTEGVEDAMVGAATAQNLSLLKQLHATGVDSPKLVFAEAMFKKNLEILKWHCEVGGMFPSNCEYADDEDEGKCDSYMMFLGQVWDQEIIDWILHLLDSGRIDPCLDWDVSDLYKGAAHGGNLGLMIWLEANRPVRLPCNHDNIVYPLSNRCSFDACCGRGDFLMLEWLLERHPTRTNPCCYLGAAMSGRVDILDYLVSRGVPLPPPANMRDQMIYDWQRHRIGNTFIDDDNVLRSAVNCNQTESLQWLLDHGVPYHPMIAIVAVHSGSLGCLQWIVDNVEDADVSGNSLMKAAAEAGQFNVLRWLTERGYSKDGVLLSLLCGSEKPGCPHYRKMMIWMVEREFPLVLPELLESREHSDHIERMSHLHPIMVELEFITENCARATCPQIHAALAELRQFATTWPK